jgi:hypothetical protein
MSKYPFKHMRPGDSVKLPDANLHNVRIAACRQGGTIGVQKGLDGACFVICKGKPDGSKMYVMTNPDDWKESVVLYGPAPYDECVTLRTACEALAGAPTVLRFSSLGLGEGVLNGLDLAG